MTNSEMVVVGDALLDQDIEGVAERLSPDAPVPVLEEHTRSRRPGGAALAAALAAQDGDHVTLVTALCDDPAARELRAQLVSAGVTVIAIPSEGPTVEKIRLVAEGRILLRLDRGTGPGVIGPVPAEAIEATRAAGIVVVSDYGRGVTSRPELRDAISQRTRATFWDPHPRGPAPTPKCTLVAPNRSELQTAFPGPMDSMRAVVERTATARRAWQARAVVTTMGSDGAVLLYGDAPPLVIPAQPVRTIDTCGAGDRFIVATAAMVLHGALVSEAVTEAVAVTGRYLAGGGVRAHRTIRPENGGTERGRGSTVPAADRLAAEVRTRGGTIVVAGGCFDLLHAGHVFLLQAARRLGDCLIVAMNSDASVRRLKGPGRPIVSEPDRAAILLALDCVDAVAVFDEDSPDEVLERLRPAIFAKGGDYAAGDLPEAVVLSGWGGQAVVLPYLSGRSTTELVRLAGSPPL